MNIAQALKLLFDNRMVCPSFQFFGELSNIDLVLDKTFEDTMAVITFADKSTATYCDGDYWVGVDS